MSDWRREIRARLGATGLSPEREAAVVEELSQHLDERERELVSAGADPEIARERTRAELNRARLLEARLRGLRQAAWSPPPVTGAPGASLAGGTWQDLRCAWRTLARDPIVTGVTVITLALGIGLNTSMFGLMNALLFKPLPFPDADRLVRVFRVTPQEGGGGLSAAEYRALQQEADAFGRFAAYRPANAVVPDGGREEWLQVSAGLFDLLGISPARGRSFLPEDETRGAEPVAIVGEGVWRDRFAGAADVLGRSIEADGTAYRIVGVLPRAATDHRVFGRASVFMPLTLDEGAPQQGARSLTVLGRRRAGLPAADASAVIATTGARATAEGGTAGAQVEWRAESLPHTTTGPTGRALLMMLLALSGCVLLIACANLANLLLARAIDRGREFAVRSALGASRLQLVRAVGMEAVLLSAAGGGGALAVAVWTTGWLESALADVAGLTVSLDWRVFAFAAGVSLGTVVLCGAAPALFARRLDPGAALKSSGRAATSSRRLRRARAAFVAAQFALATILMAGAGYFLQGSAHLLSHQFGWRADNVIQAELTLSEERYPTPSAIAAFHRRAAEEVARVPGVSAASISYGLPYLGLRGFGRYAGARGAERTDAIGAQINGVSRDYFQVTGTPLRAGRLFDGGDTAAAPQVAVISESLARRLFGGLEAVGLHVVDVSQGDGISMEVVGVVADVQSMDIAQNPPPYQLYQPVAQDPRRAGILAFRLAVDSPAAAVPAVRAALADLDPDLVVRRMTTATDRMREVTSQMSWITQLLTGFGVLGLFLAAVGIYGTTSRMVAQRTEEIGVRMALGARPRDVLRLVLASGARLVLAGGAVGLAGAWAVSRLLAQVLPRLEADSGAVAATVAALLAAAALAACYLPARRAAGMHPIVALRGE